MKRIRAFAGGFGFGFLLDFIILSLLSVVFAYSFETIVVSAIMVGVITGIINIVKSTKEM